jgi:hypothetical protein
MTLQGRWALDATRKHIRQAALLVSSRDNLMLKDSPG